MRRSNAAKSGVVLARVGAATINIAEDNKLYVVWGGRAAFITTGAKGVVYFDRAGFKPPQAVINEAARLLGAQRTNRLKHWNRRAEDHYEDHELKLVTEIR